MSRHPYPVRERALVFCRAVWKGRDPLLAVAAAGICREGLDEELQMKYAERIAAEGENGLRYAHGYACEYSLQVGHFHVGLENLAPEPRKLLSESRYGKDRDLVFVSGSEEER